MGTPVNGAAAGMDSQELLKLVEQQKARIQELEEYNEALVNQQKQSSELINMLETLRDQEKQLRENGELLARDEARAAGGPAGAHDVKQLEDIIQAQDDAINDQLKTIEEQSAIIEELQRQLFNEGYSPSVTPVITDVFPVAALHNAPGPSSSGRSGVRSNTPNRSRQPESGPLNRRPADGPSRVSASAGMPPSGRRSGPPIMGSLPGGMSSSANSTTSSLGSTARSRLGGSAPSSILATPSNQRRPRPNLAGLGAATAGAGSLAAGAGYQPSAVSSPGGGRPGPRQSDAYNPSMRER